MRQRQESKDTVPLDLAPAADKVVQQQGKRRLDVLAPRLSQVVASPVEELFTQGYNCVSVSSLRVYVLEVGAQNSHFGKASTVENVHFGFFRIE